MFNAGCFYQCANTMQRRIRIVLTDVCNFHCACCYNEANKTKNTRQEANCEQILQLSSKLNDYIEHVVLTGGEPLLYSHFDELVMGLHQQRIKIQLTTNGSFLHNLIEKTSILDSINRINISLDKLSPTNFRYKTQTTKNMFYTVVRNIIDIATVHPHITINTVYDDQLTRLDVEKLINFCADNGIKDIKFIPLLDMPEAECTNRLETIIQELSNKTTAISVNTRYLTETYNVNNVNIVVLHQYCNNSCQVCKKESFIRINCDNKINFCRKHSNNALTIKDLLAYDHNGIISILEKRIQSE